MDIPMPPTWFNPHGLKMQLGVALERECVLIKNTSAKVHITKCPLAGFNDHYMVKWEITHYHHARAGGRVLFTQVQMLGAFGIGVETNDQELIRGRYIRHEQFLNLPMPGTGMDGDPNVSIFVSDEIREAVRKFIGV